MKKIINTIIICTLIAGIFTACNSGGGGEAYTLKMRLKRGDVFKQDIVMNMKMNMAAMGMNRDVSMKMDMGSSFEVLTGDSSNKTLKMTYTNLATKMDMGMGNSAVTDSMLNVQNKRMTGKSIIMKLDAQNQITDVSGFDELLSDSMDEASRAAMEKLVSKDNMNSMFGLLFRMYPSKPVKIGESWDGNTTISMAGINMAVKIKYTLTGVKDGIATVDVDGTIDGKGSIGQGTANTEMDMKGTQKGVINIRVEDGYLTKGNYKMEMKADITAMGQKVPMTMKGDVDMLGK